MSQVTSGIRKILSHPFVYDGFQALVGAEKFRQLYVAAYVQPSEGDRILDIGCGTAEILEYLPTGVEYHGYDLSVDYIQAAKSRYNERGHWHCASVLDMKLGDFGAFDIVMANGVLHHLGDEEVRQLAEIASKALKRGGRFCSFDGCFVEGQNPLARYLISHDRGRNVREAEDYKSLIAPFFSAVDLDIRHDMLRIPYTHAVMVATKGDQA